MTLLVLHIQNARIDNQNLHFTFINYESGEFQKLLGVIACAIVVTYCCFCGCIKPIQMLHTQHQLDRIYSLKANIVTSNKYVSSSHLFILYILLRRVAEKREDIYMQICRRICIFTFWGIALQRARLCNGLCCYINIRAG